MYRYLTRYRTDFPDTFMLYEVDGSLLHLSLFRIRSFMAFRIWMMKLPTVRSYGKQIFIVGKD